MKKPSTDKLIGNDVIKTDNAVVELVTNETICDVGETIQTFFGSYVKQLPIIFYLFLNSILNSN